MVVVAGKTVHAFSARAGTRKFGFRVKTPFETSVAKYLAVENDLLAVTDEGGIYCVDMSKQRLVSSVQTPIYGSSAPPILRNGLLVTAGGSSSDSRAELIGVDVRTGKVAWRKLRWSKLWANNICVYRSYILPARQSRNQNGRTERDSTTKTRRARSEKSRLSRLLTADLGEPQLLVPQDVPLHIFQKKKMLRDCNTVEYGGLGCYGSGGKAFLAIRDLATGELRQTVQLPELISVRAGVVVAPPIVCGSSIFVCSLDGYLVSRRGTWWPGKSGKGPEKTPRVNSP